MKKHIIPIICVSFIILCIVELLVFNYISDKQYGKKSLKTKEETKMVDVHDANNVPSVDKKLGEDIKITQSYLMTYIIKKQGMWYLSSGTIKSINHGDITCTILIGSNEKTLVTEISEDKCDVKKDQYIHFVGTIDIGTKTLKLSKISDNEIDYSSATKLDINELIDHINLVSDNNFIVSGYMTTVDDQYYLYNSKGDYTSNQKNYFIINWKDKFEYTGNANVSITCNIVNSYTLKNCILNN